MSLSVVCSPKLEPLAKFTQPTLSVYTLQYSDITAVTDRMWLHFRSQMFRSPFYFTESNKRWSMTILKFLFQLDFNNNIDPSIAIWAIFQIKYLPFDDSYA